MFGFFCRGAQLLLQVVSGDGRMNHLSKLVGSGVHSNKAFQRVKSLEAARCGVGDAELVAAEQVRKSPSWPRSWANFSLLYLYFHRNAWANLYLLGQPNTLSRSSCPASAVLKMPNSNFEMRVLFKLVGIVEARTGL